MDLIENYEQDNDFYIFHFKTVWCPYNEDDHSRERCVYAHNWQDFRRKPNIFKYSKEMCSQWLTKDFISSLSQGCSSEYNCQKSHGWKEQELHPDYYRVNSCNNGFSCSKPHCPYYHSEKERRYHPKSWFKIFPKQRGASIATSYYVSFL